MQPQRSNEPGEVGDGRVPACGKAVPPEAPAVAMPTVDLDACEIDALDFFLRGNHRGLQEIADDCPRRVPPKARRRPEQLKLALLECWAWPQCRAYLEKRMTHTKIRGEIEKRGFDLLPELIVFLPPNALLWYVHAAGLDPAEALRRMEPEDQEAFAERQPKLQLLVAHFRRRREERQTWGDDAQARAARAAAERLTRQLRWRADQAEEKQRRAATQVETVARDKEDTIRALETALADVRGRLRGVEAENEELRAAFAAMGEAQREMAAALAREVREKAAAARRAGSAPPPLAGERVLVVGDDSHKVQYARIVQELGGSFAFHPGFRTGPRLDAALASATLAVYVAAYASHKTQDHVRVAERAGLTVVMVPVAGTEAFRRALCAWTAGRCTEGERVEPIDPLPAR